MESGWNVWVWLVGVVSKRWVWLVGVGGIYGCGKQEVSVSSGCGCKEVYRFPHIVMYLLFFVAAYIPTFVHFLCFSFLLYRRRKKNAKSRFFTSRCAYVLL